MSRIEFHAVLAVRLNREAQRAADYFLAKPEAVSGFVRRRKSDENDKILYEFSEENDAVRLMMAIGGVLTDRTGRKYT